jgi:hypothetical protein
MKEKSLDLYSLHWNRHGSASSLMFQKVTKKNKEVTLSLLIVYKFKSTSYKIVTTCKPQPTFP